MRSLRRTAWIAAAAIAIAGLVAVPLAGAASPAYSAKGKVFGRKTADWVADWWQWSLSLPIPSNPRAFESGTYTGVGQHGPVWFFTFYTEFPAGTRPVSVTRSGEVPSGRALLFPVVTFEQDVNSASASEIYTKLAEAVATVEVGALVFELDGTPLTDIAKRRITTKAFEVPTVPNGIFGGTPGEIVFPAASDGYWVMLRPLTPGIHTVRIKSNYTGTVSGTRYDFDDTYSLTVVSVQ